MSVGPLRIGMAGAGNIASIAQLPTLVTRDDVELRALVTRQDNPQPLMRRWGFRSPYPTVEAMLSAEELDALFVLTPRSEHVHATRLALEAGVDVFCEKPLATRAVDAQSLAQVAAEHRRVLMVGFNRRFAPVYEAGRAAFSDSGASFCIAQKNRAGSEYRATFENAIHMVDLLRWYCGGEPIDVSAHAAGNDPWQEDGVSALIRFDNGHTGVLMAARNAGAWSEKLDAYGDGVTANISAPDRISVSRPNGTTVRETTPEAFGWATATQTFGFAGAVHHFLDRVRDRRQPLTSGTEAAKTQLPSIASSPPQGSPPRSNRGESGPAMPGDQQDPTLTSLDQIVFVTGANGGIGASVMPAYVQSGATVIGARSNRLRGPTSSASAADPPRRSPGPVASSGGRRAPRRTAPQRWW